MDCLLGVDIMTDCQYSHGESLVVANDGTIYAIAQHGYKDSIISYKREADGSYEENEACACGFANDEHNDGRPSI